VQANDLRATFVLESGRLLGFNAKGVSLRGGVDQWAGRASSDRPAELGESETAGQRVLSDK